MPDPEGTDDIDSAAAADETAAGLTAEERAALKELVAERKAAQRRRSGAGTGDGERDVLVKIAEMPEPDRSMAERIHAIVKEVAPELAPRTWYGMPAYAKDGKVICFFQAASKFKVRYATFGFDQAAKLDDGVMWPTAYALTALTPEVEERIRALVRRAVG
ncbi:MAG: hypothetical protein KatS3mg065_0729 [Chloroflexota bacterium]|nr:MAG: hypothetical protein KatS3mg065_0729 [Chloroflexota bacterium]